MIDSKITMIFQMRIFSLFLNRMIQLMISNSPQKQKTKRNNLLIIHQNNLAHPKNLILKLNPNKISKRISQNYY